MQHPIIAKENAPLRGRVLRLLKQGYLFPGRSNVIFVCGGNDPQHMRPRFTQYCEDAKVDYLVFQPEYAIDHALSMNDDPFNLSDFEALIGRLSLAIIIFPEAPGSFAEAGYFSAIDELAKKSIIVLDQSRLARDSFLSIGPAKLIEDKTRFHPSIQMSYSTPNFQLIIDRVRERNGHRRRNPFPASTYAKTDFFYKFCLAHCVFDILEAASIEDVLYIFKGLFNGRACIKELQSVTSILLGAGLIKSYGDAGAFSAIGIEKIGCVTRDGFNEERNAVKIEILSLLESGFSDAMLGVVDVA
ncbi:retron St85 family effector protein [Roseovarius mucosus]|uniref:retron St85 family effector protein n=1 Tax=Roseovarius mucosus TaxID=215743 RepID=UPI003BAC24F0